LPHPVWLLAVRFPLQARVTGRQLGATNGRMSSGARFVERSRIAFAAKNGHFFEFGAFTQGSRLGGTCGTMTLRFLDTTTTCEPIE
jgi:hypothetical protein